jgi:carboxyl-terminal processing protease
MGQSTYGKGLVQQIFPAGGDESVALKLTTAKYYIPSGRCIQRPERNKKPGAQAMTTNEEGFETNSDTTVSDSLKNADREVFFTNAGRTVYGGGGIVPDIDVAREKWYPIEMNLERQSMFFDFAVKYSAEHPDIDENFVVTDDVLNQFKDYMKSRDFDYKTALEVSLDDMRTVVKDENKETLFASSLDNLEQLVEKEKVADFEHSKDYIKRAIRRELITKLYGQRGLYEQVILKTDPAVKQALDLIRNDQEYTRVIEEGHQKKAEL